MIAQTIISIEYDAVKDKPSSCRFSQYSIIDGRTGVTKTLLHAIADSNKRTKSNIGSSATANGTLKALSPIARCLLKFDPSMVYATTEGEDWEKLPVELALTNFDDEVAALCIEVMKVKERYKATFYFC